MDLKLNGKRALITGSNSGIGAGIAKMLADEGVKAIVHGRNEGRCQKIAEDIRQAGGEAIAIVADLVIEAEVERLAKEAEQAFGGLDILVNNAGGGAETENRSWFGASPKDWMDSYQRNVIGAVQLIHLLTPAMKEAGWGRIINISTAAAITPTSAQADYGPAKAAMLNMSLGLSKALTGTGVTSNAISPGMIRTEGLADFLSYFAKKRGWGDDVQRAEDYILKGTGQTVGRVGEIEDVAFAVAMLASPNSDFINGANFHIDGGISPSIG